MKLVLDDGTEIPLVEFGYEAREVFFKGASVAADVYVEVHTRALEDAEPSWLVGCPSSGDER